MVEAVEVEVVRETNVDDDGPGNRGKKGAQSYLRVKVDRRALQSDPFGLDLVGAQSEVPCANFCGRDGKEKVSFCFCFFSSPPHQSSVDLTDRMRASAVAREALLSFHSHQEGGT